MKTWKKYCIGLATTAGLATGLRAQVPAAPAAPAAAVPAVAPTSAAPAPGSLWSALGISKPQLQACRAKICATPLGQLLNGMTAPMTAISGGLMPGFCPTGPNPADLAKPATSAEGMAAKVKADEADAKARRAAVRYLGTVDCHFWPEVKAALVNSLRVDKNECVRYEAALALGRGCCCAKETLEALSITVSGSEKDGNPAETSERVKAAAASALDTCLSRLAPPAVAPAEPVGPPRERSTPSPAREPATAATTQQTLLPVYYNRLETLSMGQVAAQARGVLAQRRQKSTAEVSGVTPQDRSLYGVLVSARHAANRIPQAGEQGTTVAYSTTVAPSAPPKVVLASDKIAPMPEGPSVPEVRGPTIEDRKSKPELQSSYLASRSSKTEEHIAGPSLPASEFPVPGATQASLDQIVSVLQKSSFAEQREWAADNLAQIDWHENAHVVQALIFAAQQDSAASVRSACIRCLAKMGASTPSVTSTCQVLRYDPDSHVRQEAVTALAELKGKGH